MTLRLFMAIAAGAWLLPVTAAPAQTVHGAGSPGGIRFTPPPPRPEPPPAPVPPPAPPPAPRGDLFRAGPDTYAPRYDRLTQSLFFPYFVPGFPGYPGTAGLPAERSGTTLILNPPAAAPAPAAPPAPPAPVVRPVPKALYVIPHCYSGDTPPRAEMLPAGCNLAGVRLVAPR